MNISRLVENATGESGWKHVEGPQSLCGIDYWFKKGENEVYLNYDQGYYTISLNGKVIWEGQGQE